MIGKDTTFKDFRTSLGLTLVFVGMQFNTAIKNMIVGFDISAVIMLLSAILLIDFKGIMRIRMSRKTQVLMLFQLILLFVSIMSVHSTAQLQVFHLYLLAIIFALSTNTEYLRFAYFGKVLFWVSGFIAVLIFFQATNGFTQLNLSFDNTGKLWLSQGGDPITMSRALGFNFIACLFYSEKNKVEKVMMWIFISADVIGAFSFGNRSVIACSIGAFLVWYIRYFNRKIELKKLLITVLVIVIVVFVGSKTTYFSDKIDAIYTSVVSGLRTLLGLNTVAIDPSAKTRVAILANMKEEFDNNFVKNFLVGMGYNYTYVDRPVYQIFFDLGIFALAFYGYYLLYIPLKTIAKQIKFNYIYNGAWIFVVYGAIQSIVDQLITGLPYYYFLWTPTIFILFSLNNFNLSERKSRKIV